MFPTVEARKEVSSKSFNKEAEISSCLYLRIVRLLFIDSIYIFLAKIKKEKSNNAFFAKYYMLRIWPFQLVNHSSPPSKFSKQKTSTNKQAYIPFDNQQINKYSWITFNLLKTYLLFILLIEKTYIALPKLLL